MKRLILAIAITSMFIGCSDMDASKCQQGVTEQLKGWEIQRAPGRTYCYIARDPEGNIWWVEALDKGAQVSAKYIIIPKR